MRVNGKPSHFATPEVQAPVLQKADLVGSRCADHLSRRAGRPRHCASQGLDFGLRPKRNPSLDIWPDVLSLCVHLKATEVKVSLLFPLELASWDSRRPLYTFSSHKVSHRLPLKETTSYFACLNCFPGPNCFTQLVGSCLTADNPFFRLLRKTEINMSASVMFKQMLGPK